MQREPVTVPSAGLPPSFQSTVQVWVSPAPGSSNEAVTTVRRPAATGDLGPPAEVIAGAAFFTVTEAVSLLRPPVRVTS